MDLPYTFGRYTLCEKLAQGGMAEVYLARYEGEGGFVKVVAIKRILPRWSDDQAFVGMLIDEANVLAHLQHPNIVQVYELGKADDAYFIAMEYVPGMDCRTLIRQLRQRQIQCPPAHALHIVAEVLKGLSFAHTRLDRTGRLLGIVHRDISPQNVLLSFHGEVKVADFGIAKGLHRHRHTQGEQVKGKYAYMAPEQALGGAVDGRADCFATGALLYELYTGEPCFDGPNDLAILERVKQASLPDGWERRFPSPIRAILRRALARELVDRFPTAHHFLEEVTRYQLMHRELVHGFQLATTLQQLFPEEAARALARGTVERGTPEENAARRAHTLRYTVRRRRGFGWSILLGAGRRILLASLAGVMLSSAAVARGDRVAAPVVAYAGRIKLPMGASCSMKDCHPESVDSPQVHVEGLAQDRLREGSSVLIGSFATLRTGLRLSAQDDTMTKASPAIMDERPKTISTPIAEKKGRGTLRVAARPWGEVTVAGVVAPRETPIGVQLDSGVYQVRVRHPASGKLVATRATVRGGATTACFATFDGPPTIRCR